MRKINLLKTLLVLIGVLIISFTTNVWADTFTSDGNTYFYLENVAPTYGWGGASTKWIGGDRTVAWLHVWNDSDADDTQEFELISGDHYRVKIPAGTWKNFQIYRAATLHESEDSKRDHTGNMAFSSGKNWLLTYCTAVGWTDATWAQNRYFDGTEKIFIQNIKPANEWTSPWSANANFRLYVYLSEGTSDGAWCDAVIESSADYSTSTVYSITPPEGCYRYIKLAGNNQKSFDAGSEGRYYTGNIEFTTSDNYISGGYSVNGTSATWGTFTLSPITSDGTRKLYFDMDPEGIIWTGGYVRTHTTPGDGNFAFFFGTDDADAWSAHSVQVTGDYYYIVVPEGTWNGWIMTRNNTTISPSWDNKENQTGDMFFSANKNYMSNWYDQGTAATWGQYAPTPAIILNQGAPDAHIMNLSEGTTYTLGFDFEARSTYEIKILDGETLYGLGDNVWSSSVTNYTLASGQYQVRVNTASADTYTFTYNQTGNTLSLSYPTVTHPNADYCYIIDYSGETDSYNNSWSGGTYTHWWGSASGVAQTNSPGTRIYNKVKIGTYNYFYFAPGDYASVLLSENGDGSDRYQEDDITKGYGKYAAYDICTSSAWNWCTFDFAVTLNTNSGTINAGNVTSYTFGVGATLPTNVTRAGYTFAGWYDNEELEGLPITTITTTDNEDKEYWAKWTPVELTFDNGHSTGVWNDEDNWDPACVPTINHDVIIQKAVTVTSAAKAKSVVIDQSGENEGKLTINAGKSLVIAGTLKKTTDGSTKIPTESADVVLHSALYTDDGDDTNDGNAALIMKEHSGSNKATVNFATKAYKDASRGWVNQYIGTPFNDQGDPTYNYYGMELYEFNASSQAWEDDLATSMTAFHGYDLLCKSATQNVVLNMTGTLVASDEFTPSQTVKKDQEVMFANSWVAPIDIESLSSATFTNADQTIYIFNAGSPSEFAGDEPLGTAGTTAGHYTTIPIGEIPDGYTTIPSMQAFSLIAEADGAVSLALSYEDHVYTPATTAVTIEPAHAPQKVNSVTNEMYIKVRGASGYGDNVRILENSAEFTPNFDKGKEGRKLYGIPETPQLYAICGENNMAVLAVPDVDNTVLGFQAGTEDSQYTFSFVVDETAEDLYLYDIQAEKETHITNDATYTFTTSDKAAHNRFVISKTAKMPMGIDETSSNAKATKFIENGELLILRDGKLYNATGALVK